MKVEGTVLFIPIKQFHHTTHFILHINQKIIYFLVYNWLIRNNKRATTEHDGGNSMCFITMNQIGIYNITPVSRRGRQISLGFHLVPSLHTLLLPLALSIHDRRYSPDLAFLCYLNFANLVQKCTLKSHLSHVNMR